ncbi:hypothetical protein [Clostridium sp. DL1XJH146]
MYYEKFKDVHYLLKQYECKSTYDFEEQYSESNQGLRLYGSYFYKTLKNLKEDINTRKEQKEKVAANLDVVIKTNMKGAKHNEIRFDIDYSDNVQKYSMYISLPTHSRSIPLSKQIFNTQNDVIIEIEKWIKKAKCKKKAVVKKIKNKECNQLSFI